jgi:hypothetical protein
MALDDNGENKLGAHMNTPIVAIDMKATVEALARPRTIPPNRSQKHIYQAKVESVEKIQYWGFLYGTLLGETFAGMYPNLVGRMVLDGVVDADRHYAGKSSALDFMCALKYSDQDQALGTGILRMQTKSLPNSQNTASRQVVNTVLFTPSKAHSPFTTSWTIL